ncbi:MAG TPA: hypothetical protein VGO37_16540 [Steroidobacteraceae bacterium]|nr:hypothetical protein [Steroidobacteraceae bacterium]
MPDDVFRSLANAFLLDHPQVSHEWRTVKSRLSADRVDLVCAPGAEDEVYASLLGGRIAVGDRVEHSDFADYGHGLSAEEIARDAFNDLVDLLRRHGHLAPAT